MDFTSLTGRLLSAGITRTLPPAPVSVDGHDRELSLWLPVEGEVEVARKNLPSRAVIQFDDVGSRNGTGPSWRVHSASAGNAVVQSATPSRRGLRVAAAPSLPWPAMWPATPPTMAPLCIPWPPPARRR